jgi:hypothetical protein
MYDRTHNINGTHALAKRTSNINTSGRKRMSNETILEKMKSRIILNLHEEWARKNGYIENDRLNSQNTTRFKDGAER